MGPSALITLDTSAIVALLDSRADRHVDTGRALVADGGPYLVPAAILAELAYVIERRLGARALDSVLDDLEAGRYRLECGDEDLPRIRELIHRYASLPLGLADAAVVACSERNAQRVLTVDRRDFDVVGRELGLDVLPA